MAEHVAVISITYQILGESEDYSGTITIRGDSDFTIDDLTEQISKGFEDISKTVVEPFGMNLIKHMAVHTAEKDTE